MQAVGLYSALLGAARDHLAKKVKGFKQFASDDIRSQINAASRILESVAAARGDDLRAVFEHIAAIEDLQEAAGRIIADLAAPSSPLLSDMSDTYIMDLEIEYRKLVIAATTARAALSSGLSDRLAALGTIAATPAEIHTIFCDLGGRGVTIYAYLMNRALEAAPQLEDEIMDLVDQAKDLVLDVGVAPPAAPPAPPLQRFQIRRIPSQAAPDGIPAFHYSCPAATPLTYNTSTLNDPDTVAALDSRMSPNMGVNDLVMAKWNVLRPIQFGDAQANNQESKESGQYAVSRVLDGKPEFMGVARATIVERIRRGPSPRIAAATARSVARILPFVQQNANPPNVFKQPAKMNVTKVSNSVVIETIDFFERVLRRHPPQSLRELGELADDRLEEKIGNIVMASDEAAALETTVTWLAGVDALVKGYVRYIHEGIARSGLKEKMFREKTPEELARAITTALRKIVEAAAKKSFDPDRDIYEAAAIKTDLMRRVRIGGGPRDE